MKKRTLCIILGTMIIISVVILAGLNFLMRTNLTEYNNYDGVTMTLDESTLSVTGISLIVQNETDKELTFGEDYTLEKKIFGKWYRVMYKPSMILRSVGWNDIGLPVSQKSERTFEIDWMWLYGNLEEGKYRIVKNFIVNYPESYNLAVEFSIPASSDKKAKK